MNWVQDHQEELELRNYPRNHQMTRQKTLSPQIPLLFPSQLSNDLLTTLTTFPALPAPLYFDYKVWVMWFFLVHVFGDLWMDLVSKLVMDASVLRLLWSSMMGLRLMVLDNCDCPTFFLFTWHWTNICVPPFELFLWSGNLRWAIGYFGNFRILSVIDWDSSFVVFTLSYIMKVYGHIPYYLGDVKWNWNL